MPVYLNALAGKGVHVVTVNDYLAKRDAEWMGQVYRFLGLTVGVILHDLDDEQRREAYACDVTYGTNNELGFDYLRDNMKYSLDAMVQRGHHFAIVDEVNSILIDEARTPLIISGPDRPTNPSFTSTLDTFIPKLVPPKKGNLDKDASLEDQGDYDLDEKQRQVNLTEAGNEHIENMLREAELLQGREPLRHRERHHRSPRQPGVAGAQAVPARPGLHRQRRQGHHHRRVHRPHDGGPALFGRPASGA